MVVAQLAALHEADAALEVVHHPLRAIRIPPFGGEVALAATHDDPETGPATFDLFHLRHPALFLGRKMDVSAKEMWFNPHSQLLLEKEPKAVQHVIRHVIRAMDQRILAANLFDFGIALIERRQVGIALPQRGAGSAQVGEKAARMREMQIAHGGGERDNVAGAERIAEEELARTQVRRRFLRHGLHYLLFDPRHLNSSTIFDRIKCLTPMHKFSDLWKEPSKEACSLVALDTAYQWMLPLCAQLLRSNVQADIEAWTWGDHTFDPVVLKACARLGVDVRRLPVTGQYCKGWEARHHALCLTEYRRVFMLDVDTYVMSPLGWLFRPMEAAMRLRAGDAWENYQNPHFARYFQLPEQASGYTNYSVWFGEYDRVHPSCREVLCRTSDLLGGGPAIYREANVVGDQDIRNGILHHAACPVERIEIEVDAWANLAAQLKAKHSIVHQAEKALTEEAANALATTLGLALG